MCSEAYVSTIASTPDSMSPIEAVAAALEAAAAVFRERHELGRQRQAVIAGVMAVKTAYARWVSQPEEQDLSRLIRESLDQLKVLTSGS